MDITSVTVALPVSETQASLDWYRRLLPDRPELHPVPGIVELFCADSVWLQLMGRDSSEPPAHILRIGVRDLACEVKRLHDAGIATSPPVIHVVEGGSITLVGLADPDGNCLCLYELRGTD